LKQVPNFASMPDATVAGWAQGESEYRDMARHVLDCRVSLSNVMRAECILRDVLMSRTGRQLEEALEQAEKYFRSIGNAAIFRSPVLQAAVTAIRESR
jgi:hypothetical protein